MLGGVIGETMDALVELVGGTSGGGEGRVDGGGVATSGISSSENKANEKHRGEHLTTHLSSTLAL